MSNLLKSKFFLGVMIASAVLAGGALVADAAYVHTGLLKMGMTSSQVMSLQQTLNSGGFLVSTTGAGSPGMETMYFGARTKAAVLAFQSAKGLSVDGVVGAQTGAALAAMTGGSSAGPLCPNGNPISNNCNPVAFSGPLCPNGNPVANNCNPSSSPSPSGPLTGGAGDITLTLLGTYSGEEVGEGEDDVEVLAVDVKADEDSDVELDSVKVEFHQATAADDRDLPDYASEVSVWLNGEKVGSADTSDFTESSNFFSKSISLSGAVIRAGDEDELVIAVTANNSLDSGDIDTDAFRVDLLSVRFTDASGVTTTESGSAAGVAAAGTYGKNFDFATFATANDAELTLTLEDAEINDVHLLDSDNASDTDHPITSVLFDASGDSDIWVDEVTATITTTGETDESVIVVSTWIEVDGVRISEKETVVAGGAVTYDDLDHTISAGDAEEWIFWVTMQDVGGALDEGDTVQLTVGTANTVAEDEAGDTVTASGSNAIGGVHLLYDNGIRLVGHSQKATAFSTDGVNNDRVELELIFDVFNYGDVTLYIPDGDTLTGTPSTSATTTAPSTTEEVGYHIQTSGTVTPPSAQVSAVLTEEDSDLTPGTNAYELKSGKTGTFNLKVTVSADENPSIDNVGFRALLAGLGWATSDVATAAVVYTADLGDYKTNYATIAD